MNAAATERDVVEGMIQTTQERLAALEERLAFERRYLADLVVRRDGIPANGSKARRNKQSGRVLAKGAIESGSLTDQIVKVLQEHKKAMRATDIARELTERGVTTTAKNGMLPMALSTLSRRKNVFRKVSRGLYTLADQSKVSG